MAENVRYDIAGYDEITTALMSLINTFPALDGEQIHFSELDENYGKAMFPVSGGVIVSERESVTAHVTQTCQYPFTIICRTSGLYEETRKATKEWLDSLGRWLEKQTVKIGGTEYTLSAYPDLTGDRRFLKIERTSPAYLDSIEDNKAENWGIQLSAHYITEFNR